MTNFPKCNQHHVNIRNFSISDGGTIENFRWVKKMLGSEPNPLPLMSRIDLLRMMSTRSKRQMLTPEQKWAHKKAMAYIIKHRWSVLV